MVNRRLFLNIASGDLQTDDKAHHRGTNRPVPAPATRGMIAGKTLIFFVVGRGGGVAQCLMLNHKGLVAMFHSSKKNLTGK